MALAMFVAETQHLGEAEGRREHRANLILDADFDPLRDRDLALAREQRDLPHLAQVDAYGVVARPGVFLLARVWRARFGTRPGPRRVDHLDVVVAKEREDFVDLLASTPFR